MALDSSVCPAKWQPTWDRKKEVSQPPSFPLLLFLLPSIYLFFFFPLANCFVSYYLLFCWPSDQSAQPNNCTSVSYLGTTVNEESIPLLQHQTAIRQQSNVRCFWLILSAAQPGMNGSDLISALHVVDPDVQHRPKSLLETWRHSNGWNGDKEMFWSERRIPWSGNKSLEAGF